MVRMSSEGGTPMSSCSRGRDKIFVTVRVRPLSSRETSQNDASVWDCINSQTIAFRTPHFDRSPHSKCYIFDRVFGPESNTQHVYEEGAKDIALSALTGLNATIFAYGQTSSGKTFTMRGITENAIQDIYAYMEQHRDRNFILKVSALEIYNEVVKDMLNMEGGPLRLLDDPEKGTVVERLVEDVVQNINHLKDILSVVEAQRQVGETLLNDRSSRSHQIIRFTIESSSQGFIQGGFVNSLVASLNFVDLAGSERASQTLSEGPRLKEGCHINRSLLTLTTIIRKLSGQGRGKTGHLPYRDSKLTRILQNALGGNARTAIICTLSPAQSHVEQSRNTLFFAMQAKEVVNTARVNLVVSDKALVKQLQKEVARLEAELKAPEIVNSCPLDAEALLHEKNAEIQQLRAEMKELYLQRDRAQARLDEALKKIEDEEAARAVEQGCPLPCPYSLSPVVPQTCTKNLSLLPSPNKGEASEKESNLCAWKKSPLGRQSVHRSPATRQSATASLMLVQEIRKLEHLQDELGEDAGRALEALQKEVECLRLAQAGMNHDAATTIAKLQSEIRNLPCLKASKIVEEGTLQNNRVFARNASVSLREEISRLQAMGDADQHVADSTIATLEEQLNNVQKSLDNLVLKSKVQAEEASPMQVRTPCQRKPQTPLSVGSSNNKRAAGAESLSSPRARRVLAFEHNENNPPNTAKESRFSGNPRQTPARKKQDTETGISVKEGTPKHQKTNSLDLKKVQSMFKTAAEENIQSIRAYVTELKERVAKLQYQKQLLVCQVLELEANGSVIEEDDGFDAVYVDDPTALGATAMPKDWKFRFQEQRMHIVKLWDVCQVSIIHRSQFFLLFNGDSADEVYMEVELRRLTWLQEHFSQTTHLSTEGGCDEDESSASLAASSRALKREREQFARRMRVRLTEEEREEIYCKWDVALDSKQRKLQVAHKVWTDVEDLSHIEVSAQLVAKVVGFWESGREASKEMFGLTFAPPNTKQPWLLGWNSFLNNLTL